MPRATTLRKGAFVIKTPRLGIPYKDAGTSSPTADPGVQIWNLDPARWVTAACEVAGRNLTREEWETHIGDLAPYRATCPDLPIAE